mgnify:FL=1
MERNANISKPTPERPALEPPQFSLATMFLVVAALGVLFGLMTAVGPLGGFALLLFVLVLIAHVAGNSIGTRLRDFGNERVEDDHPLQKPQGEDPRRAAAPASNLSLAGRVSLTMLVFTIAGAVFLGSACGTALIWLTWSKLHIATAVVAVVSPTVLGGIIGFAISSFTQAAGGAWLEASASHRRDKLHRSGEAIGCGNAEG